MQDFSLNGTVLFCSVGNYLLFECWLHPDGPESSNVTDFRFVWLLFM